MSKGCDELRDAALANGLESREGLAWRVHCRGCAKCREELFILETLQRQARDERRHLGRREVETLLQQVRTYQGRDRRPSPVWAWTWRLACLWIVFAAAALVHRSLREEPRPSLAAGAPGDRVALAAPGAALGAPGTEITPAAAAAGAARPVGERIREVRQRVTTRKAQVLRLIDGDLGEPGRQDVWDSPIPLATALV